uniref:L,D-transpeptidase family protein n=1 Tax=Sphingomonas bacterium TaxID=1895847 RepID=UPI0026388A8F|nr:L,D-transpeptidase family protein [Sphingomonas bacterium]
MKRKTTLRAAWLVLAPFCLGAASSQGTKPKSAVDQSVLQVQVILDHLGFAPGVLDGKRGQSLTAAIKGFQESRGLRKTGLVDDATSAALDRYRGWRAVRTLRLSADSLAGPFVNPLPKKPEDQAKLPALSYSSAMEKLAEMFHTTPAVLLALNGAGTPLKPGSPVAFPNALPTSRDYDAKLPADWRKTLNDLNVDAVQPQGTKVVVDKSDQVLRVLDADDHLVAQFSATMGSEHDPLPIGRWKIQGFSYNPKFHYNPTLFWDAKASDKAATLPAGPNGPVGVIWIDLSKPHYGIHGTPEPSTIGRAESHGCIRLSNWDAARLSLMIKPGTPAVFQE